MTTEYLAAPGTPELELETPALVIDMDVAESNIERLQQWGRDNNMDIRPHSKTHKTPLFARKQIEAGAIGVCCAKVGEAEVMVAAGIKDVMITNQIIGEKKLGRLASLAAEANLVVAVESEGNTRQMSEIMGAAGVEIGVIVEVNTGMDRCGTAPGEETIVLSKMVDSLPGLRYDGLMGYEGHMVANRDEAARRTGAIEAANILVDTAEQTRAAGLDVKIVSAAGTGTYNITGKVAGITDLQCGSYIFMDGDYLGVFNDFDPALSILSTVISVQNGYVVTDTGKKSISEDRGLPDVVSPSGGTVSSLSEEHCKIEVTGDAAKLKVGDRVRLRPSHGDTTINMHSHYFLIRNGKLEMALEIAGRGRVR